MHHGDWDGGWWWLPAMLTMVMFWGGLIAVLVVLVRRGGSAPPTSGAAPQVLARQGPEEILAERLARGEIEPDDYRQRLEALRAAGRG